MVMTFAHFENTSNNNGNTVENFNIRSDAQNEYQRLLQDVKDADKDSENAYRKLMNREENVLSLINRVVGKEEVDIKSQNVASSGWEFFLAFFQAWRRIYHDVVLLTVNPWSLKNTLDIFIVHDRQLYVGVMLVIVSLFLFFTNISS